MKYQYIEQSPLNKLDCLLTELPNQKRNGDEIK